MTDPASERRVSYLFDKDLAARDEAALVCGVILDVLRDDLKTAHVDAYTDFDSAEVPEDVRAAESALRKIGAAQHRRDPHMGIELDLPNPEHASLLGTYAPWSINVDLYGDDDEYLGSFHDGATSIHFRAGPRQAVEIAGRLTDVGAVISEDLHNERRRQLRHSRSAVQHHRSAPENSSEAAPGQGGGPVDLLTVHAQNVAVAVGPGHVLQFSPDGVTYGSAHDPAFDPWDSIFDLRVIFPGMRSRLWAATATLLELLTPAVIRSNEVILELQTVEHASLTVELGYPDAFGALGRQSAAISVEAAINRLSHHLQLRRLGDPEFMHACLDGLHLANSLLAPLTVRRVNLYVDRLLATEDAP